MNIRRVKQTLLTIFVVSEVIIASSLVFFKIRADNHSQTTIRHQPLQQKVFSQTELNLITYKEGETFYLYKDYFQFLILEDLSLQHSPFLEQNVRFYYDNLLKPRSAKVVLGKNNDATWNYSII